MRLKRAFTLIELLVVIAIIAILSAILFPVMSRAKDSAYKSGDLSNMNSIRTALQLYRLDHGGYPPALLGYVTTYTPGGTDTVPADLIKGFLYPGRVSSINTFRPAYIRVSMVDTTTAVWPKQDNRPLGSGAVVDTTGDGKVTAADDKLGSRQAYGPTDGIVCRGGAPCATPANYLNFYKISGYDVSDVNDNGTKRTELRYALFWSNWAIGSGSDPDYSGLSWGNGSSYDDTRQLGYSDPPDTTPITWNTNFRDYSNGKVVAAKRDIVVFLGGAARPFGSNLLDERSWRIMP